MSTIAPPPSVDLKDERPVSNPPGGPPITTSKEILFGGDEPYLSKLGFSRGKDLYRFYKWNRAGNYKNVEGSKWYPWICWVDKNVLCYLDRYGTRESDIDNLELPTEELLAQIDKEQSTLANLIMTTERSVAFGGSSWHSSGTFVTGCGLFHYIEKMISDSMVVSAMDCQWWNWYLDKRALVDKCKCSKDRAAAIKSLELPSAVISATAETRAETKDVIVKNGDVETIVVSSNPHASVYATTENVVVSNGGCRTMAIVGHTTPETLAAIAALRKRH